MRLSRANSRESPITLRTLQQKPVDIESTLENWLHANPRFILDEPLLVLGRQTALDNGISDLLGIDQWGNTVVCEVKRGSSGSGSASEESILSQPQAYASDLASFGYRELNDLYHEYSQRLNNGEWPTENKTNSEVSLQDAYQATFGSPIQEDAFNQLQRLVVVAEAVTARTESNARFLLEQGLNFQVVELQRFVDPTSEDNGQGFLLSANNVVDYDSRRVRPKQTGNPTYGPEIAALIDRIFPELRELVEAETTRDVFPENLDVREPALTSQNPTHPSSVSYSIRLKPLTGGVAQGALDIKENDEATVKTIREHAATFEERGFTVSRSRATHRVVMFEIGIEDAGELADDDFQYNYAEQYIRLLKTAHEILLPSGGS